MKAKIFAKLTQEYSPLGLGDEYLMSKAESLAATGLVTDDNIDAVVACQRKELEQLQKANDKRVTDALEKERKKHEEEIRKKEEEAKAKEEKGKGKKPEDQTPPANDDERFKAFESKVQEILDAAKKRDEEQAAIIKTLTDKNAELGTQVKNLTDKNAAAEAAAAAAAHQAKIEAKAKELGVPQWRIEEGFNLAQDATDETITETLTKVANNINTNLLPGNRNVFPIGNNEPSKEEFAELAASIVK